MNQEQLVVYGAGGAGREAAWLADAIRAVAGGPRVVAFADDTSPRHGAPAPSAYREIHGVPVMSPDAARDRYPEARLVVGVGDPRHRERMATRAAALGFSFATLIHPRVERSSSVAIGAGSTIAAGSIVTVDVEIGAHVQINCGCTVSHDAVLGDFCTLSPGVHVPGAVHLGRGVFVGIGAVFVNGTPARPLRVGDGAVIGAGAVVTRDVPPGATVVGVPARPRA